MATLNAQNIKRAGVKPTYVAASAGGDRFTPDEHTFLHVKNGGGASVTVTIPVPAEVDGDLAVASVADAIAAGQEAMIGPFPAQMFTAHDGSGLADVSYSAVASVTVAVLRLSQP